MAVTTAKSQDSLFIPPVSHDIVLAGSFGELRSTHFHTGLDIKPSGKPRDSILCIADGYISRIKISRSGYGRALYIDHPSGHTSVYAHLQTFGNKIDAIVLELQRVSQSYEIEVYPQPGKYPIAKGEHIGILGNSGRSYGPHLHFEIRETESELPVNPLLYGIGPTDHLAPTINYTRLYAIDRTTFEDSTLFASYQKSYSYKVPQGSIGIGLNGYDQMDGASNYNGIYNISLYVDDQLHYSQTLDTISFFEMDQIKAHVDYKAKKKDKSTITRLYRLPGNKLRIVDIAVNEGLIEIKAGQSKKIKVIATDWHGNTSERLILLTGVQSTEVKEAATYNLLVDYNKGGKVKSGTFTVSIPVGAVTRMERLTINPISRTEVTIGKSTIPLLKPITINVALLPHQTSAGRDKLFLGFIDGKDIIDCGSELIGDTLTTQGQTFGRYKVLKDDVAPVIKKINYPSKSGKYHTFSITDDVVCKGSAEDFTYKVYVNGDFVPAELKSMNNTLYLDRKECNATDQLRIEATDRMGNTTVWTNQ